LGVVSGNEWSVLDFEDLYALVGDDLARIPWASLRPHPNLVSWLDQRPAGAGRPALVVGCGLGDDAEELRRRGYRVSAFDYAATAIGWCRRRFPQSTVAYRIADLFDLPADWAQRFALVVEINTIQSLPPPWRSEAIAAIAATVASGGQVFVRCLGRADDEAVSERPWAVSRRDLSAFVAAGLREIAFTEGLGSTGRPTFQVTYQRLPAMAARHGSVVGGVQDECV
jgi:SAM-dependent methyltransferase